MRPERRPQKRNDSGGQVFITGLREFEIAYLPGCGKVVSYLAPIERPAPEKLDARRQVATPPPATSGNGPAAGKAPSG